MLSLNAVSLEKASLKLKKAKKEVQSYANYRTFAPRYA